MYSVIFFKSFNTKNKRGIIENNITEEDVVPELEVPTKLSPKPGLFNIVPIPTGIACINSAIKA